MKQIFKKTNRFLAAFLAVAMIVTMLPVSTVTAWASLAASSGKTTLTWTDPSSVDGLKTLTIAAADRTDATAQPNIEVNADGHSIDYTAGTVLAADATKANAVEVTAVLTNGWKAVTGATNPTKITVNGTAVDTTIDGNDSTSGTLKAVLTDYYIEQNFDDSSTPAVSIENQIRAPQTVKVEDKNGSALVGDSYIVTIAGDKVASKAFDNNQSGTVTVVITPAAGYEFKELVGAEKAIDVDGLTLDTDYTVDTSTAGQITVSIVANVFTNYQGHVDRDIVVKVQDVQETTSGRITLDKGSADSLTLTGNSGAASVTADPAVYQITNGGTFDLAAVTTGSNMVRKITISDGTESTDLVLTHDDTNALKWAGTSASLSTDKNYTISVTTGEFVKATVTTTGTGYSDIDLFDGTQELLPSSNDSGNYYLPVGQTVSVKVKSDATHSVKSVTIDEEATPTKATAPVPIGANTSNVYTWTFTPATGKTYVIKAETGDAAKLKNTDVLYQNQSTTVSGIAAQIDLNDGNNFVGINTKAGTSLEIGRTYNVKVTKSDSDIEITDVILNTNPSDISDTPKTDNVSLKSQLGPGESVENGGNFQFTAEYGKTYLLNVVTVASDNAVTISVRGGNNLTSKSIPVGDEVLGQYMAKLNSGNIVEGDITWVLKNAAGETIDNTFLAPYGLTIDVTYPTVSNQGVSYWTLRGTAAKVLASTNYTLTATVVKNGKTNTSSQAINAFALTDLNASVMTSTDDGVSDAYANHNPTATTASETFSSTQDLGYTAAKLKADTEDLYLLKASLQNLPVTGTIVLSGTGKDKFTLTGGGEVTLSKTEPLHLTIAPTEAAYATAGGYTADIVMQGDAYTDGKLVLATYTFTVNDSLTVKKGTQDITLVGNKNTDDTYSDSSKHENDGDIDLGTVYAGEALDVSLTVSGTNGTPTWQGLGAAKANLEPRILNAVKASFPSSNTIKLTGTLPADAYDISGSYNGGAGTTAINTALGNRISTTKAVYDADNKKTIYYIDLPVEDGSGANHTYTGVLTVLPARVAYTIKEDSSFKITDAAGTESWVDKDDTVDNTRTLVLTNNSSEAITITAKNIPTGVTFNGTVGDGSNSSNVILGKSGDANSTQEVTVALADANYTEGAVKLAFATDDVKVDPVTITFKYTKVTSGTIVVTDPVQSTTETGGDADASAITISPEAILGQTLYSKTFRAEGSRASSGAVTWTIDQAKLGSGTAVTGDANIRDAFGLEIGATTGTLSGTPLKKGILYLHIIAEGAQGDTPSQNWYQLTINGAKNALSSTTAGINKEVTKNSDAITETITVTNGSYVDLSGLTIGVNTKADGSGTNATNGVNNVLGTGLAFAVDPATATFAVDKGKSKSFKVTIPAGVTKSFEGFITISDKATTTDGNVASQVLYAIPIKVTYKKAPVISSHNLPASLDGTIKVGTEYKGNLGSSNFYFTAVDSKDSALDTSKGKATWAMTAATSNPDPSDTDVKLAVPKGLSLGETTGILTGEPEEAGKFAVAVTVTDTTTEETGTKNFILYVTGAATVKLEKAGAGTTPITAEILEGAVQGVANSVSTGFNVVVDAAADNVQLSGLKVSITDDETKDDKDDPLYTGSAAKFLVNGAATANLDTIPAGSTGMFSVSLNPNTAVTAPGTFKAKITVEGAQIAAQSFTVQYTVTEKLAIANPTDQLTGKVSGTKWNSELVATGAGTKVTDAEGGDGSKDKYGQSVTWAIIGETTSKASTSFTTLRDTVGLTSLVAGSGTTGATITGGILEAASGLKTAGTYNFTVQASVAAVSTGSLKAKAQTATQDMTLTIEESGNVFVSAVEGTNADYTGVVDETDGKLTAKKLTIDTSDYSALTDFAYLTLPTGYSAINSKTFTVTNRSGQSITLDAQHIQIKNDTTNGKLTINNISGSPITNGAGGTGSFDLNLASGLAKGSYSADLVISGTNFADVTIDLTITVEDPSYTLDYYASTATTAGEALSEKTADIGSMIQNSTGQKGYFLIHNNGNIITQIASITEVANANGGSLDSDKSDAKLDTTTPVSLTRVSSIATDGTITTGASYLPSATQSAGLNLTRNEYLLAEVDLLDNTLKTAGKGKAYVKVVYQNTSVAGSATLTNANTTSEIITIDYTVLKSGLEGTVSPSGTWTFATSTEGYKESTLTKEFTFENAVRGTSAAAENALANVTVQLEGTDKNKFKISVSSDSTLEETGTDTGIFKTKLLAEGESIKFNVTPVEGLPFADLYRASVVIHADNQTTDKSAILLFTVNASSSVDVKVAKDATEVEGTYGTRLFNTLAAMAGSNGVVTVANSGAVVKAEVEALTNYNAGYAVDVNDSGKYDLAVYRVTGGKYYAIKVSTCDVTKFENALTYSSYTSAGLRSLFRDMTFKFYETVTLDMKANVAAGEVYLLNSEGVSKAFDDATNYPSGDGEIIYVIPYGSTLASAEGTVTDASGAAGSKGTTIIGLPAVLYKNDSKSFETFYEGRNDLNDSMQIVKDWNALLAWHEHKFTPGATTTDGKLEDGTEPAGVKWTWAADHKSASVELTCQGTDKYVKTLKDADVVVVDATVKATSYRKGGEQYTATATDPVTGYKYIDTVNAGEEAAKGYEWKFDDTTIVLDKVNKTATISATAQSEAYDAAVDGPKTITVPGTITNVTENTAKCGEEGKVTYTVEFAVKDVTGVYYENDTTTYTATKEETEVKAHNENPTITVENFNAETLTGTVTAVCPDCGTELYKGELTATKNEDGSYKFTFTSSLDGKTYSVNWVDHKDHVWELGAFSWAADFKSATAVFTCKEGGEKKDAVVTVSEKTNGEGEKAVTRYTATVSVDPDGTKLAKPITEDKYVKADGTEGTKSDFIKAGTGDYNGDEDGTFTANFVDGNEYVYSGSKQTPAVVVTNGDRTLMEGVDYKVSYKNNLNAAEGTGDKAPTVTVSGMGDYTSKLELKFTITKQDIDDTDVLVGGLTLEKDAKKIQPIVTYNGTVLKLDKDYTVAKDGDTGIKITGTGTNFTGDRTETVVYVDKKELDKIKVTWPKTNWVYDGEEFTFIDAADTATDSTHEAQIKVEGSKSKKALTGDDYIISYSDNVNAGSCKVTVTAVGGSDENKYTGSVTKTVKIAPTSVVPTVTNTDELMTAGTKYRATGAAPFVALSAKIGDSNVDLVYGKDYTVKYSNNKNAGEGTATVSFIGNYKGVKAIKQSFKINKPELIDVTVTAPTFFYNEKKTAAKDYYAKADSNLFVTVDGQQLKKSEYVLTFTTTSLEFTGDTAEIEYEITVSPKAKNLANTNGAECKGTYEVVKSSATDISKAKIKIVGKDGKPAKIGYTGAPIEFDPTDDERQADIQITIGSGKSAVTLTGADVYDKFEVTYVNNINKGNAFVVLTADDEAYAGSAVGKFSIKAHTFVEKDKGEN